MLDNVFNVKLITHGRCHESPGIGALGFIILDDSSRVLAKVSMYGSDMTDDLAAYKSLIEGLEYAAMYTGNTVDCFLNNKLVMKQVIMKDEIRDPELEDLFYIAKKKEGAFKQIKYTCLSIKHTAIIEVEKLIVPIFMQFYHDIRFIKPQ